jgi:hypothetical protein
MDVPNIFLQQDQYQRFLSDRRKYATSITAAVFETTINVEIDSIVKWYVRSDRCYHSLLELESIILHRMKPYFVVEHDDVEGYGYGSLASRSNVAKFFLLPDLCPSTKLKNPTLKDIVSVALTFHPLVKPSRKKANQQNKNFNDFMRVELAKLYECSEYLIGMRVKLYKMFYDFYLRAKALELKRQACDSKRLGKDESDEARFEKSISVEVSTITQQKIRSLTDDLICLEVAHMGFKTLVASTDSAGRGGSFNSPASIHTGIDPTSPSACMKPSLLEATLLLKRLQTSPFSRGELPKEVVTLLSAFICILSLVAFGPHGDSDGKTTTSDFLTSKACIVDEVVRQCDDIPPILLKSLRNLLHAIITPTFMNTLHVRSNIASDFIRRMIFGRINRIKKKKDLSDVSTASIAVHYILQKSQSCFATANTAGETMTLRTLRENTVKKSGALKECETESDVYDDPVSLIVEALIQLKTDVTPDEMYLPDERLRRFRYLLTHLRFKDIPALKVLSKVLTESNVWNRSSEKVLSPSSESCQLMTLNTPHVIMTIISSMQNVEKILLSTEGADKGCDFISLILRLEGEVAHSLNVYSFSSATGGISFADYMSSLLERREDDEDDDEVAEDVVCFREVCDSLLDALSMSTSLADTAHHTGSQSDQPDNTLQQPISSAGVRFPRSKILALLSAVPLGYSCLTCCLWDTHNDGPLHDFITAGEDEIEDTRSRLLLPEAKYIPVGRDCIPVPCCIDYALSQGQILSFVLTINYPGLGAWCLAAHMGLVHTADFKLMLRDCLQSMHDDDDDKLIFLVVQTSLAMPSTTRGSVLILLLETLSEITRLSLKDLQGKLFFSHFKDTSSASSRASLVSLTSDVRHLKEFSELAHLVFTKLSEQAERAESYHLREVSALDSDDRISDSSDTWKDSQTVSIEGTAEEEQGGIDITTVSCSLAPPAPCVASNVSLAVGLAELRVQRRVFINQLLMDKFDYDALGNRTTSEKYDSLLRNTTRFLASGIYFNDAVHFIYELIQNADDSEFAEGVTPSVIIEINQTEMRFHTNEKGWQEEHIVAACALCESSKEVRTVV